MGIMSPDPEQGSAIVTMLSLHPNLHAWSAAFARSEAGGDHAWVVDVLRDEGPALVRLLWRMLGREQDVLDAYQDTFCRLMARSREAGATPARGYVYRTAMNIALDMRRRRSVRHDHLADAASRLTSVAESQTNESTDPSLLESLRRAVDALPQRLREVIALRDLAGMPYRDVARILGLSCGTARVYRREAIVALSALLKDC